MSSVYPGSLDSFTAKTDGVDYNLAAHINDLQDAVVAIETELGLVLCYGRELYADMLLWSDGKPENMPVEFREYFDWDLVSRLIEKYIER